MIHFVLGIMLSMKDTNNIYLLICANDIALLSKEIEQAKELLRRVETSVGKVVLRMNAGKTKYMSFNHVSAGIQTLDGTSLEEVTNFKYLGALMESSAKESLQGSGLESLW